MRVKWEENRMWRDESEDEERENRRKRLRLNERCVTGGTQLANHRGSCDASVPSFTGLGAEGTLFLLKITLTYSCKSLTQTLAQSQNGPAPADGSTLLQVAWYNPC